MDSIKVFAPATVANVACGFDVMGFALDGIGDEITVTKTVSPGLVISSITGCDGLPTDPKKNVSTVAVQALIDALDIQLGFGLEFNLYKKVVAGSGLGSSASSSASAVYAANILFGKPFCTEDLVYFAMQGEKAASGIPHADNVAPSLLGGFTLVRSYSPLDVVRLDYPADLYASVVHPQIEIITSDSKKILKRQLSLNDAITQWGNVGGLVAGLAKGDYGLISRSLQDVVAEPVRSILIPLFTEAKESALQKGALGCSISGSGPSIFALSKNQETAESIGKAFKHLYQSNNIDANVYVSKVNAKGAMVIE